MKSNQSVDVEQLRQEIIFMKRHTAMLERQIQHLSDTFQSMFYALQNDSSMQAFTCGKCGMSMYAGMQCTQQGCPQGLNENDGLIETWVPDE